MRILELVFKNLRRMTFKTIFLVVIVSVGFTAYCISHNLTKSVENTFENSIIKSDEMKKITVRSKSSITDESVVKGSKLEQLYKIEHVSKVLPQYNMAVFACKEGEEQPFGFLCITNYPFQTQKLTTGEDFTNVKEKNAVILPNLSVEAFNKTIELKSLVGKGLMFKFNIKKEDGKIEEKTVNVLVKGVYAASGPIEENNILVNEDLIIEMLAEQEGINVVDINNFKKTNSAKKLSVYVDDAKNVTEVAQKIEKLNLETSYIQKNIEGFHNRLEGINKIGDIASIVIIVIGIFFLINSFIFSIKTREKEIGIMKTLGYSNFNISKMVFLESLILMLFGAAISVVIQFIANPRLSKLLASYDLGVDLSINLNNIISLSVFILIFSAIISILPIRKCLTVDPINVLKGE